MDRHANDELNAARDVAAQIIGAVAMPDGERPTRGSGAGRASGISSAATPRTVEAEDGTTRWQAFTELDSTETGACAF
jgi:hypothetical protein